MFKRNTLAIWLGILALSGAFLMGQDSWTPAPTFCVDLDEDGYGTPGSTTCAEVEWDCDDDDPAINPGAVEIPDNDVDENCDDIIIPDPALDMAMLVDFVDDDVPLMLAFLQAEPTPDENTDVTILGSISGHCQWTIVPDGWFDLPFIKYDYQAYNESGLVISGSKEGDSQVGTWSLQGNLELSGTSSGWIAYQMLMSGLGNPDISSQTWQVCNYDNGCTNPLGDTSGVPLFTMADLD